MHALHRITVVTIGALLAALVLALGWPATVRAEEVSAGASSDAPACSLSNPIVDGAADPSIWYRNGPYYLAQSDGDRSINVRASATLGGLGTAAVHVIWTSPLGTDHSAETWAPEIEFLDGQWVVYFAADDGSNDHHWVFAITNPDPDPLSANWSGKITDSTDQWAIDPTVFFYSGSYWMLWSGTPTGNGGAAPQQIFIAHMSDPLHIDQDYRRLIANPDQPWETSVAAIEEGPEAWIGPDGTLTIVYNANASWTSSYSLGELVYHSGDVTQYTSYEKRGPVFSSANGLYGTGGESLPVPGASGINWNVCHADSDPKGGWAGRSVYAQPVPWNSDGTPDFGTPAGAISYDEQSQTPCGTPVADALSPSRVFASGGATVIVTGANFTSACAVSVDGAALATTFLDDRTLRFSSPSHVEGTASVAVSCPGGRTAALELGYGPNRWSSSLIYTAGDRVGFGDAVYVAQWWTQGETPGASVYGPWAQEGAAVSCATGPVRAWTASWVYTATEVVADRGHRWRGPHGGPAIRLPAIPTGPGWTLASADRFAREAPGLLTKKF